MKKRTAVIYICFITIAVAALILIIGGWPGSKPPGLTVSNEYNTRIKAMRGTYSWQVDRNTTAVADSSGPLALYKLGELPGIEPSENDDYSLTLIFDKTPQTVTVLIYPESSAATEDYGSMILRSVSGLVSGCMFTVPDDHYLE